LTQQGKQQVISFIRTKGWGTALSIVFSSVAATVTVFVFLYLNVPTTKQVELVTAQATQSSADNLRLLANQKTEFDQKLVELKEEQKELRADNVRLRTEVRDELRELRQILLSRIVPKKYSHFDRFNRDGRSPFFKETKTAGF